MSKKAAKPKRIFKSSAKYLKNMIQAGVKIREYIQKTNKKEFLKQTEVYDAVCMQFSHMGEQVKLLEDHSDGITRHFRDEIAWSALKALRNRIDHDYLSVEVEMIWDFASKEVGEIEMVLRKILEKRFGEE